ncbi:MAG: hypothetical protein ABIJ91_00305 [Candidatus Kuenenbacteria bacterium]
MLETSKDLLFIVLAFCALLFTGFVCIMLWQFISIIGNIRSIMGGVKQKLDLVDDVIKTLKEKIASSANYIALIVNAVEKIVNHLQNKKSSRGTAKKAKTK